MALEIEKSLALGRSVDDGVKVVYANDRRGKVPLGPVFSLLHSQCNRSPLESDSEWYMIRKRYGTVLSR